VFRRQGYGLASVADIAAESGMTKGALYFHFASKDDLARAVIEEQHRRTMAAVRETLAEERPAVETMMLLSFGLAEQLRRDPVVQAGIRLTTDVSTFEQPVADPYRDWMRTLADLTRRGIAEGDVSPAVDPDTFGRFFSPAFTGVQLVSETLTDHADLLPRVLELWQFVLPGLASADRLEALRGLLGTHGAAAVATAGAR
jgi:AcrR family transcriptional regulator